MRGDRFIFTGLVEDCATIVGLRMCEARGTMRMRIRTRRIAQKVCVGDSISVNGVCLTVVKRGGIPKKWTEVDVVCATLQKTALSTAREGCLINLERAMRVSDRWGGHF